VERTQVLCRNTFSAVELVLTAGAEFDQLMTRFNWCFACFRPGPPTAKRSLTFF